MSGELDKSIAKAAAATVKKKKQRRVGRIAGFAFAAVMLAVILLLTINSIIAASDPEYYMTFGNYRLFPVVTDSMSPEIPSGSLIATERPNGPETILPETIVVCRNRVGDTFFEYTVCRTVSVNVDENGRRTYELRADGSDGGSIVCTYDDIVGIYRGAKAGGWGAFFAFFRSAVGLTLLILSVVTIVAVCALVWYIERATARRKLKTAALKKSAEALSGISLRYDNIHGVTAVMDVLDLVTEEPKTAKESRAVDERLNAFIKADNIELPQTPETVALLDSLPAPDTPGSLAAALAAGATLRQAEDGQTLVLTTISGGKNIMLTPVQTADGIILCQQGARIKSDIAPNLEDIGISSMPASPEFFEGLPLEKNVIYPELPQPARTFGPDMLRGGASDGERYDYADTGRLSMPVPTGTAEHAAIDGAMPARGLLESAKNASPDAPKSVVQSRPAAVSTGVVAPARQTERADAAHILFARYRELSARNEIRQTKQLGALLKSATPLTDAERKKIDEYKAAHKASSRKTKTDAERAAARDRAEYDRACKQVAESSVLAALTEEERELFAAEQKLDKTRGSTVRKLMRIAADREILKKTGE